MATLGGAVVLFGGTDGTMLLADTWTWDGTDWTGHVVAPPRPREAAMMATLGSTVVLFGGLGGSDANTELSDTWTWNGSSLEHALHLELAIGTRLGDRRLGRRASRALRWSGRQRERAERYVDWSGTDWSQDNDLVLSPPGASRRGQPSCRGSSSSSAGRRTWATT